MRMVDREYAFLVSSSRKDIRMQRGFPHHRFPPKHPGRRPMGGAGLVNLIAGVILGVIVYRKGIEEGKKQAQSQKSE